MKFMWNGKLFTFRRETITIVDNYGDTYEIRFTELPEGSPIEITAVKKRNYNEDIEQLKFQREIYE